MLLARLPPSVRETGAWGLAWARVGRSGLSCDSLAPGDTNEDWRKKEKKKNAYRKFCGEIVAVDLFSLKIRHTPIPAPPPPCHPTHRHTHLTITTTNNKGINGCLTQDYTNMNFHTTEEISNVSPPTPTFRFCWLRYKRKSTTLEVQPIVRNRYRAHEKDWRYDGK